MAERDVRSCGSCPCNDWEMSTCQLEPSPRGNDHRTWDNSDEESNVFAIAAFASGADFTKERAADELAVLFGPRARDFVDLEVVDWGESIYGVPKGQKGRHHNYGMLKNTNFMERVIWSGTESERDHGHMEGAVKSGKRAASELLALSRE